MMRIATLVASDGLSAGDADAASDVVRALGGEPGAAGWLEPGIAATLAFDGAESAPTRDALEAAFPAADVFVRPADAAWRLFVADMDSTMITVECIDELADYVGLKAEVAAVTEAAMQGELDFAEALDRRVALLEGLAVSAIDDCLAARVRQTPGAATLVRSLRAQGVHTLLVSGGFTHFAQPVAAAIGFDDARANVLETSGGRLTGRVLRPIVDAGVKRAAVIDTARTLGASAGQAIAIGDGANDLLMVEAAGLGVAYHAKPKLAAAADARVRQGDLTALLYGIGIGRDRWATA